MSKQTAVEWYEKEINSLIERYEKKEISKIEFITMKHNLFYNAKEMEEEQQEMAFNEALDQYSDRSFEQYYNETYKK